ncbi:MAG: nucleotidyltransferase domain-containing protein, partial [Woeseia sp.]
IDIAFVFGSMATGEQHADSDLDLCVLGDVELLDVVKALKAAPERLRREINPVVMATKQYKKLLSNKDRFAERLRDDTKIFVMGDEREFAKLVKNRAT